MNLSSLGWDACFAKAFEPFARDGFLPARVVLQHKSEYELLGEAGHFTAVATGRLRHDTIHAAERPAVGDWVLVRRRPGEDRGDIHALLPRRSKFSRRAAGDAAVEQVVAANIDTALLVTAADQNYNLRRLERYLTLAWESGAQPVIVLNKSDLLDESHLDRIRAEITSISSGTPAILLSALQGAGLETLAPWLQPGRTLALLGSSGVGKSTLINRLLGVDRQATGAISAKVGKGRHTTTHRELIVLPSGALVLDTPGMRELQLWEVEADTLDVTFADVTALGRRCRFRDCRHGGEPGCAIQAALEDGSLDSDRWTSYLKLCREQAYAARKSNPAVARETKAAWKKINQQTRKRTRFESDGD